jgi:hypothetical protein
MRAAALGLAGLALLTGCAGQVAGTPAAAPTLGSSATPAAAPGPAGSIDQVSECLRAGIPAATLTTAGTLPPGGVSQVFADIERPDLPKGTNRVGVVKFPDPDTARGFVASVDAAFEANGGSATAVGPWAITTPLAGDDAAVAAARRCVSAGS